MDTKPRFLQRPTSDTLAGQDSFEAETKATSPEPAGNISTPDPGRGETHSPHPLLPVEASPPVSRRGYDIFLFFWSIVMLSWPWIFWGIVFHVKGIQATDRLARIVVDHPRSTNFFVTLIGNLVRLLVGILFSFSVVRFAQEWLVVTEEATVFQVSLVSAFRYQRWPWGPQDLKIMKSKWSSIFPVGICIGAFAFIPSGTTSLLTPAPFNKTAKLNGTELDLSSTGCFQFLDNHPLSNDCGWHLVNGTRYTSCLSQNQLTDVLDSGRGNVEGSSQMVTYLGNPDISFLQMLSRLSDNSQSLNFAQLGDKNGLHFLGPLRGILPIGPNGVPAFNTIHASAISDPQKRAAILSYNYTIELQGLSSNVSCIYDKTSPISFGKVPDKTTLALQYNGTCGGQADILNRHKVPTFTSVNAKHGLGYWACKSSPSQQEQSYYVYLRGRADYTNSIGNITCTISPIQPALFPVTYQSQPNIFSLERPASASPTVYHQLIESALVGLGGVVHESQNWQANMVAESVITFATKYSNLEPSGRSQEHLNLYAAMIQGMLEYEATYLRLIYSTIENPPLSCTRIVNGMATYQVIGWFAEIEHVGFIMPMSLVNLSSLVLIIIVMCKKNGQGPGFDPAEVRPLLAAEVVAGQDPGEWDGKVTYHRRKPTEEGSPGCLQNLSQGVAGFSGNVFPSN